MGEIRAKRYLKKSEFLNRMNRLVKSYMQEYKARRNLTYYREKANQKEYLRINKDIPAALEKRLVSRNLTPTPKKMGDLQIFLAFYISNWESVLPKVFEPFGKVTAFEWRSLGFDDRAPDWIKHRDKMNAKMWDKFIRANDKKQIDAFVGYLSGYNTDPSVLREIGRRGAVIFNFCWDDKLHFPGKIIGGRFTSPAAIASAVDLNITNSPESVVKYLAHGGLALFSPQGAHPDIHKPYDVPYEFDVSFVGQKYGWRPNFIKKLRKMGLNVAAFGRGWENGHLTEEEMVKLYSRSRINLGFAGVGHSRKLFCIKGRDFEIPMSGGLYLTQHNPELSLIYEVGKEIVTYQDEDDCAKKILWLLDNPEEAEKIRKSGRSRALRDHTWEKRFHRAFVVSGILEGAVEDGL